LTFGLGPAASAASATIVWASGQTTELPDLEVDRLHVVVEPGLQPADD
jgi:hypothetical protein